MSKKSDTFLTVITHIRTFSLNLGTALKNFQTSKYSLEIFPQKEWEYHKFIFLKFFRKTLRSNFKFLAKTSKKHVNEFNFRLQHFYEFSFTKNEQFLQVFYLKFQRTSFTERLVTWSRIMLTIRSKQLKAFSFLSMCF